MPPTPGGTVSRFVDRVKGAAKQVAGKVTGDELLEQEGRLHEAKADASVTAEREAEQAEAERRRADVTSRERELAAEAQEVAAEEAAEAREARLERERAEESARIER